MYDLIFCRHSSKDGPQILQAECVMCAMDDSIVTFANTDALSAEEEQIIDELLTASGRSRHTIEADELCLINAWYKALVAQNHIVYEGGPLQLLCDAIDELKSRPFSYNLPPNYAEELERYKKVRDYTADAVDFIPYALASVTRAKANIFQVNANGTPIPIVIEPVGIDSSEDLTEIQLVFLRIGGHYDISLSSEQLMSLMEHEGNSAEAERIRRLFLVELIVGFVFTQIYMLEILLTLL